MLSGGSLFAQWGILFAQWGILVCSVGDSYKYELMKGLCHQNMNAVSILPVLLRPRSRGEVRLQSTSPWDPPLLDPKYLTEDADLDLLVEAVQTAFQLVNSSKRLQEHKFQVEKKQPHRILLGILKLHVLSYV